MKQIYELKGAGYSARAIAREFGAGAQYGVAVHEVAGGDTAQATTAAGAKLDAYAKYIDRRMGEGLENCAVLLRELRELGYDGSYTILSEYVRPRRRRRQPEATMRFDTATGEQTQVDWGSLSYRGETASGTGFGYS